MERYGEYKDSGIKWLGDIPSHWECVRVKALFQNIREKNNPIQTEERLSLSIDKGVTLYSEKTTNLDRFKEDCSQYLLAHEDDIVLNSMNMIVGAVGKSKYFGCVSPAYYVIRLRDTSNQIGYYSQLLNIQKIRDVYRIMGKGIMAIDRGDGKVNTCRLKVPYDSFGSIKIPVPPISEQSAIVMFLENKCALIDKAVFNKQKQIELLAEMKDRIIADAVTHGLNHDSQVKDSGIFWIKEIPSHWKVRRLGHFLNKQDRPRPKDAELLVCTNKAKVIKRGDSKMGLVADSEDVYQGVRQGDLLIHGMDTWHGAIAVSDYDGMCTPVVHVCTSNEDVRFVSLYLRFMATMKVFKLISNGVRQNTSDFRSWAKVSVIPCPLPPLSEQIAIVSHIEKKCECIETLTIKLQHEIDSIKEYKQRLISDVVTGQIKVY